MTDKELKKLNRAELLEMLIAEVSEVERLNEENAELKKRLEDKELAVTRAGSIAEASIQLNGVFEAAQAAAEQYLLNVRQLEAKCDQMRADAQKEADDIVARANEKAVGIEAAAQRNASAYWNTVSEKLEQFYNDHQGLRALLRPCDIK